MAIPSNVMQWGPYLGRNLAFMLTELERFQSESSKRAGSNMTSAAVNGRSFTYGAPGFGSLDEWEVRIREALHFLDPDNWLEPVSNFQGVVR